MRLIKFLILMFSITQIALASNYEKQINQFIDQEITNLKNLNIQVDKKAKNDTVTTIKREYILTIKDITPFIKDFSNVLTNGDLNNLKLMFNNTKLLLKFDFLKYPTYHKNAIEVSIYSLNPQISQYLNNSMVGKQILKYIKNRTLTIISDVDGFSIVKTKLKDLNINLSDNLTNITLNTTNIEFLNHNPTITSKIGNIKFIYSDGNGVNIILTLNNLIDITTKQDDFNYQTNSSIQNISVKIINNKNGTIHFSLNKIKLKTNSMTIQKNLYDKNHININNFSFGINDKYVKVNKIFINNIIKLNVSALQNLFYEIQNNSQNLAIYIINFLNNGLTINFHPLRIKNVIIKNEKKYLIDPITLNYDVIIPKNSLYNTKTKLYLETTQKNIDLLSATNPEIFLILLDKMKIKNNKVIIDMEKNLNPNGLF